MNNKSKNKKSHDYKLVSILLAGTVLICLALNAAAELANSAAENDHRQLETVSQTIIAEGVLTGLSGVSTINISAGDGNIQQNSAAIAVAGNGGLSAATISPSQKNQLNNAHPSQAQELLTTHGLKGEISSGAFAAGFGMIMVNQSSGSGNTQLNGVAIAMGAPGSAAAVELDDSQLAAQASMVGNNLQEVLEGSAESLSMEAYLAEDAFRDARGIVQINQVVGNGNRTINALSMTLQVQSQRSSVTEMEVQ